MQELLRLMESAEIHGVVTKEFSRLMRPENFTDYALLQAFVDTRTVLYLPDGPIDLSSKSGRLLGTIRAAIAGLERTEILERIWAAKEEKRRAGKHPQSWITLPFGVGYDRERGWYYTAEAEKVREGFRLFLSGETSYWAVGRKLGIEPTNLRVILRNPIYTGWRVYDKRRDPSPGARRAKNNGRQADRPKILRPPDEVIRIRVLEPLVSEVDFARVQQIIQLKTTKHWRSRPGYQHRFTYNGFLMCGCCSSLIYTHHRRADYYVCKNRRLKRAGEGCPNPFMRRERLEPLLDSLFSRRLTDRGFLEEIASQFGRDQVGDHGRTLRLQQELQAVEERRQRILESYFDGVISREERDQHLAKLERDAALYREMLREPCPVSLTATGLAEVFSPFYEWEFLSREAKRHLLQAITPEIYVENYDLKGLTLLADTVCRNDVTPTGKGSWPRPA